MICIGYMKGGDRRVAIIRWCGRCRRRTRLVNVRTSPAMTSGWRLGECYRCLTTISVPPPAA